MEQHKAILVDDNPEHLKLLSSLLSVHQNINIIEKVTDPTLVVEEVKKHSPDILFLDIEMPAKSGFEIVEELAETQLKPEIVFVTSHDEYAIKAFEYAAFDYLIKPVDPDRLEKCIERINGNQSAIFINKVEKLKDTYNKLIYKSINGYTLIEPDDILFIEADGNYIIIHQTDDRIDTFSISLGEIEKELDEKFYKTHRSAIINTDRLYKIDTKKRECIFRDDGKIYNCKVSKDKISGLLVFLK